MHINDPWTLSEPLEHFFFDCDGTLSLIEGIDVLADMNGVAEKVRQITERCMAQTGMSIDDYRERLNYVQPTLKQIEELSDLYIKNATPGAYELIQALNSLNKNIYIISAGIKAAVIPFAQSLGIPARNVLAVETYADATGNYTGFDEQSNMVQSNGKLHQIHSIIGQKKRSLLVGDGITDWEARKAVTRFIGFAGLSPKDWVQKNSDFYISTTSLYPIIPLGLSSEELNFISLHYNAYYEQGMTDISNSVVLIKGDAHVHCPSP